MNFKIICIKSKYSIKLLYLKFQFKFKYKLQKIFTGILYIIVLIGICGNVNLMIKKLLLKLKPLHLMELLLMFSDVLLLLYFLILIIMDFKFDKNYLKNDIEWRSSYTCNILEFTASTSCLLSNFSLLLITFERYLGIRQLTSVRRIEFKQIFILIFMTFILSISLSYLLIYFSKVIFFSIKHKIFRNLKKKKIFHFSKISLDIHFALVYT